MPIETATKTRRGSISPPVAAHRLIRLALVLLSLGMTIGAAGATFADSINVSAAVSMKESMTDIATAFEASTHDQVNLTFGASGQLASQISNGAPADLFISAADKEVDDLNRQGLTDPATRKVIASNEIVLIVPADSAASLSSFEQLKDPTIKRIAIGEPKTVPAGQYAMEVLTALKLSDDVNAKLIYGVNVRQVLAYVERGEVSAGVVYSTDAIQAGHKVKVAAVAKPDTHQPVVYPAVVLKGSGKKALANKLLEFISSDKGADILKSHGFTISSETASPTKPVK